MDVKIFIICVFGLIIVAQWLRSLKFIYKVAYYEQKLINRNVDIDDVKNKSLWRLLTDQQYNAYGSTAHQRQFEADGYNFGGEMKMIFLRLFIVLPLAIVFFLACLTVIIPILYWIFTGENFLDLIDYILLIGEL